ncbi:right-handed parallel beta-helix repeat-containing protein [Candidatus Micrarchaeota archaeon]|nr:right-handed parallel beta-helix repeat-containing protein [Candidatus Micrarchaeota archaeon]
MPTSPSKISPSKSEPQKALPPYKGPIPNWLLISFVAIVAVIFVLVYIQSKTPSQIKPIPQPTLEPTIKPTQTLTPTPSEIPLATIAPIEYSGCSQLAKSITLKNDLETKSSCFTVLKEGITIDCNGFRIIGKGTQNSTAIYSEFPKTTVKNCQISNFEIGIRLRNSQGNVMDSNTFSNNFGGALIEDSSENSITNNQFFNHSQVALFLGEVTNSKVDGNFFDNGNKYGLQLVTSHDNEVSNNQIYRFNFGFQLTKSRGNSIKFNNVSFNSAGIKLTDRSSGNKFTSNYISSNKQMGLHVLDFSQGNIFEKNTIVLNEYGANIRDSNDIFFNNNYACSNTIEDVECSFASLNATGNICTLRATTCGFDCIQKCTK